jgi:hypothetical protein
MPETTPITDLSTEIDRMLAAAQAFAEFAVEAQRIEAALRAQQSITRRRRKPYPVEYVGTACTLVCRRA